MNEESLYLFGDKEKPDHIIGWQFYQKGLDFKNRIQLFENVKLNENFFVGK